MKTKLILPIILILLFIPTLIFSQNFSGIAVYQSKINVDLELDKDSTNAALQNPEIRKMLQQQLKKQLEKKYVLNFTSKEANFIEEENLEIKNPAVQVKVFGGTSTKQGILYKDISKKDYKAEKEFFGKRFLVEDKMPEYNWEMTNETKKIGNYTCHKAIAKTEESTITAWYTMEIPLSIGPDLYSGLPGMILEINDGKRQFLCTKITLNPKKEIKIKIPKNGKKVKQEQFEKIVEKKIKTFTEQHKSNRGNSNVKIIRQ
ncbi:GLPGLI family protein [Aureivirga sp. CE67]|uniref:GLPGLI family protein n=1 Tax=Aureivirga sp. CE67 TaxID=1788983 RepID=UPI0018CA9120|nr:GLPGLI family protein [Aureivirga sp. CE67]